jgi:hypothetical protein
MFSWLSGLLARLFQWAFCDHRQIFRYHDGSRYRYADPIVIDRESEKAFPGWRAAIELLEVPDVPGGMPDNLAGKVEADRVRVLERLVSMVRAVFKVKELNERGRGLSEAECLKLLTQYVLFEGRLVEAAGPFSNLPASVAASPPASVIEPSADSTSAVSEFPTFKPAS